MRRRRPARSPSTPAAHLSLSLHPPSLSLLPHPPQLEEEIQDDLKWSIRVNAVLHSGKSDFQSVELVDSGPFGKVREKEWKRMGWMDGERAKKARARDF